jgi:hydrogenase nickel incorporation protein HypA/HybF
MHETAVAQNIIDSILAESSKQKANPVSAKICCGSFNSVNDELLTSAFETLSEGTTCENMELNIEHIPLRAKCGKCGGVFEFDVTKSKCTNCGSEDFDFLPDQPLTLESIEFEQEDEK